MIAPLRLDEDLVPVAVGEAVDLVLDRRAVARPDRGDGAAEQRRAVQVVADERVRARVREGDVTVDLGRGDGLGLEGERHRLEVARLPVHAIEIDRVAPDARRRAGLEPAHRKAQAAQRLGQTDRRLLVDPPAGAAGEADVQQPPQEGAGGHDRAARFQHLARGQGDARELVPLDDQIGRLSFDEGEARCRPERAAHPLGIAVLVGLGARGLHGRSAAGVEQAELDAGLVDGASHLAAEGVDLAHQMALGEAADRRVAGHAGHRPPVERHNGGGASHARRGQRGFAAGVPGADDHDVEAPRPARLRAARRRLTSRCRSS